MHHLKNKNLPSVTLSQVPKSISNVKGQRHAQGVGPYYKNFSYLLDIFQSANVVARMVLLRAPWPYHAWLTSTLHHHATLRCPRCTDLPLSSASSLHSPLVRLLLPRLEQLLPSCPCSCPLTSSLCLPDLSQDLLTVLLSLVYLGSGRLSLQQVDFFLQILGAV